MTRQNKINAGQRQDRTKTGKDKDRTKTRTGEKERAEQRE